MVEKERTGQTESPAEWIFTETSVAHSRTDQRDAWRNEKTTISHRYWPRSVAARRSAMCWLEFSLLLDILFTFFAKKKTHISLCKSLRINLLCCNRMNSMFDHRSSFVVKNIGHVNQPMIAQFHQSTNPIGLIGILLILEKSDSQLSEKILLVCRSYRFDALQENLIIVDHSTSRMKKTN